MKHMFAELGTLVDGFVHLFGVSDGSGSVLVALLGSASAPLFVFKVSTLGLWPVHPSMDLFV